MPDQPARGQLLHLVFGGELSELGGTEFKDLDRLDEARDGGQHFGEGCVGGELCEYLTLGRCNPLGAFSVRDVARDEDVALELRVVALDA